MLTRTIKERALVNIRLIKGRVSKSMGAMKETEWCWVMVDRLLAVPKHREDYSL